MPRRNAALINNAEGVIFGKLFNEVDDQAWDNMLVVNLTGAFCMAWALLPAMIRAGGGAIVNVSSDSGLVTIPLNASYCPTKH